MRSSDAPSLRGVYTYPISFAIPANAPPSLSVDYGSVVWRLKAVVHRPGAFKTKLTASHDITVVATPGEDDTEESESIIVERQWDSQMQYLIVISGRSFSIGGHIPITITFMPWTKMKIYRVSVIIEGMSVCLFVVPSRRPHSVRAQSLMYGLLTI